MAPDEEKEAPKFKVKDRRFKFDEDDNSSEQKSEDLATEKEEADKTEEETLEAPPADKEGQASQTLPPITFSTFILSLSTSALIHLGVAADPNTGSVQKSMIMAKQTIDMLDILKKKTAGNLTKEEDELLSHILYDLRMRYIEETKKEKA